MLSEESDRCYWVQVEGKKMEEEDWWNEVAVFWNSQAQIWKGILFLKGKGLKFDIFSYNSIYFVNLFNCQCLAFIQIFFFFFLSSQEEIRVTVTHCLMVADGVSVRSSKPNTVQSSQLALPELRNIICSTCDGNLGRQTFQSVLVSETINVSRSRTACSFIASAKVWDHLSKRPVLV